MGGKVTHRFSRRAILSLVIFIVSESCFGNGISEFFGNPPPKQAVRKYFVANFLGFFFVYVTTPRDLYFHLGTFLDRLLLQLWSSCLFVLFVLINSSDTGKEYRR